MNDHIKSEISSYLAGGLPESRNRQIEAHAVACEKCRNALSKTRAKLARIKREALKKASTEDLPNLFWDRQRKLLGMESVSSGKSWLVAALVVAAGGGYWAYRAVWPNRRASVPTVDNAQAEQPSAATAAPVAAPTPPAPKPKPASTEPESAPLVMPTLANWKGDDSGVTDSRLVVVRDADTWQKLWTEMALKDPLPAVDFAKATVLGIFAGEEPVGSSIMLGRIEAYDTDVRAPYRITVPDAPEAVQGSSAAAPAPGPVSHPYLLATIQRVEKKIRLTQREKRS